ncbi:AAA family ATPase [Paenactinomyces guangxiensis]|uniref:Endonuclease GajA/Old nuclease/RecF-like AAA domain-containing protein n=1 Tax=Paenactinomyces guangxiensis TaxID=1490290 RepID=A0A7W1WUX3_9BACL|nr:AAA family ATPase [Paenactinomyces guangxiensis]MBA4496301.1 hypothetical protein [Paenactinomyces guangxiensis]MBH8593445.1 hypothetical protein [Paenactinomyces guangxiensis]
MQLESLYIKEFKKLKDVYINFIPKEGLPNYYHDYFKNNSFSVLVGENGSGKTTLMSFIAQIFHNLQRYHSKIQSDFVLKYRLLLEDNTRHVILEKEDKNIFISVAGILERSLLKEWDPRRGDVLRSHQQSAERSVSYHEIKDFLPVNVITSVISIHGEYPENRRPNYQGHRAIKSYNISGIYGQNHFGIPSLSKGICRFIESYRNEKIIAKSFLKALGLAFTNKVAVHPRYPDSPEGYSFYKSLNTSGNHGQEKLEEYFGEKLDEYKVFDRNKEEFESYLDSQKDESGWVQIRDDNLDKLILLENRGIKSKIVCKILSQDRKLALG